MNYVAPSIGTSLKKSLLQEAMHHLPMGVADNYRYWGHEDTVFVSKTGGFTITDCDGVEYADFRLAYGPIILGYRDSRVDDAVVDCIRQKGTISGFSSALDADVVKLMKGLCPNVQKVRFANSGTEAVMGAVRCARGYTQRDKIVVVEGGFHGLTDEMMWKADVESWDQARGSEPSIVSFGSGLAASSRDNVVLVSLNDVEAVREVFSQFGEEIAALVIEPIMGNCGSITATADYLSAITALCQRNGSLLIADEVKTGFRVAPGGAQQLLRFTADLTTFAKAIGNGYPIAAFGGRADVMDSIGVHSGGVVHGGTYTANLIGLSAAKATLDVLTSTRALATVEKNGQAIMDVLASVFEAKGQPYCFAGHSSMFGVHFTEAVPSNYRDWKSCDNALYVAFAKNLIRGGVMLEPDSREPWFICEAHRDLDLAWLERTALDAMDRALLSTRR